MSAEKLPVTAHDLRAATSAITSTVMAAACVVAAALATGPSVIAYSLFGVVLVILSFLSWRGIGHA
jgi:hypothetical protein